MRSGGGESPYQDLARFEPGDRELFFDRDALAGDAVRLMKERWFAVLLGASGSGKFSLLRAGATPRRAVVDEAGSGARLRLITPGARPAATHYAPAAVGSRSAGQRAAQWRQRQNGWPAGSA